MITPTTRSGFTALVAFVLLLVGVGAGVAQRGPVKIGMLVPLTGPLAANGKEMANGLALYLDEHRQQLAGRDAKLIVGRPQPWRAKWLSRPLRLAFCEAEHFREAHAFRIRPCWARPKKQRSRMRSQLVEYLVDGLAIGP